MQRLRKESLSASASETPELDIPGCEETSVVFLRPHSTSDVYRNDFHEDGHIIGYLDATEKRGSRRQQRSSKLSSGTIDEASVLVIGEGLDLDGASDDTVDGVTDREDLHTEDESIHSLSTSSMSQQGTPMAVRVAGGRDQGCAFRRQGWSSSGASLKDENGHRAAREDQAVSASMQPTSTVRSIESRAQRISRVYSMKRIEINL